MKAIAKLLLTICIISSLFSLASCSMGEFNASDGYFSGGMGDMEGILGGATAPDADGGYRDDSMSDSEIDGETGKEETVEPENKPDEIIRLPAGMITAGAWNDNDNYMMWCDYFLQGEENGKFFDYTISNKSWGFNSLKRVKVTVTNGEKVVAGAKVVASDAQGKVLYSAVTDAQGKAYVFTEEDNGVVTVTSGDGSGRAEFTAESRELTVNLDNNAEKRDVIEIMFVVDVTGSMGDEISFLKAELADVINKIAENNSGAEIKLALLFYRDNYDDVPFDYYDFTDVTTESGLSAQQNALNKQYATGGGDYPEAVDEALEIAVNKQWSTGATTKLIFQVLDAPAHNGNKYKEKFLNATKIAAEKGIRICPIICSGAAGETEYTMREAAIYTGGTFIFVTDDSGIGGSHHDPNLPNATIELLNSMLVRLVNGYHTGSFADPIYWKDDPNLSNK